MKRQAFRLAPVLELRRTQQRVAALAAARAAADAAAADARATEQERALETGTLPSGGSAASFVAALVSSRMAASDAAAARALAVASAEQAELVRRRWTEAAQRTKGLERLQERHLAALAHADELAEIRTVDDLVTRQHADVEDGDRPQTDRDRHRGGRAAAPQEATWTA